MRIAYLSDSIMPGRSANSIQVMNMCQAFAELGHEVMLIIPHRQRYPHDPQDLFKFYGIKTQFEIRSIPWKHIPAQSLSFLYDLLWWQSPGKQILLMGAVYTPVIFLPEPESQQFLRATRSPYEILHIGDLS